MKPKTAKIKVVMNKASLTTIERESRSMELSDAIRQIQSSELILDNPEALPPAFLYQYNSLSHVIRHQNGR